MDIQLTNREKETYDLLLQGKSDREIAQEFYITLRTARNYTARILSKTDAKNRIALISKEYLSDFNFNNLEGFTDIQKQIIKAIAEGDRLAEIAKKLGTPRSTVVSQLNKLYIKTNTANRQGLMLWLKDKVASRE